MDPDGTIYFILNFIISFILCLYIGTVIKNEQDFEGKLGVPNNRFSGFLLFLLNFWRLSVTALPKFNIYAAVVLGALFVMAAVILPFCLGLAVYESPGAKFLYRAVSFFTNILNHTVMPVLMFLTHGIFRLFKLETDDEVTRQDVMDLVEDADEDVIDDDQKEMIENIFELDDTKAEDIMTHRTDVFAFNGEEKCRDIIDKAIESGFSRIPVYDGTIDTIIGFLYSKDLLAVMGHREKMNRPVKNFVRKAMFVPEACGARELLVQFKKNRTQIAIVVDEYGGTSGIISMEDILEEIVGNIQDEYDDEEELFIKTKSGAYICQASMEVDDLLELMGIEKRTEEEEDLDDFDSIGGLIINRLERIPTADEHPKIAYKGLIFTVLEVAERRIVKVKVEKATTEGK